MKKTTTLLILLICILLAVTGCSQSTPADNQGSTPTQEENDNKNEELKTFDDVIKTNNLTEAVYYLDENYDAFSDEEREAYMKALASEIFNRSESYLPFIYLAPIQIPAPMTIENVNSLYEGRYSADLNTLYISGLNDDEKEAARKITNDDFFTLCKKYYTTDGEIGDIGFDILVEKDIYETLMNRYSDYQEVISQELQYVRSYTDEIKSTDTKFESDEPYPFVLVNDPGKIEILRNEFKTEIWLPVKIEENSPADSENTASQDDEIVNMFDALTLEERMERVLINANEYTWGFDDGILSAKDSYIYAMILNNFYGGVKTYINETYIFEIPSTLDFNVKEVSLNDGGFKYEFNGQTYAFLYNSIFDENIEAQDTVEIYPFDPPLIDTTLESIDEIYENTYRITGSYEGYEGTSRIEVTVEYGESGIILKSVERFEGQTNTTESSEIFRIKEVTEYPEDAAVFEFINPAYVDEPIENFTKYIFMVDGYFDSVRLLTQKSIGEEEEEYQLVDMENGDVALVYYTMFPTDFSNDVLIIRSSLSGYEYEMQLNDAVERDLYLFEEK